MRSICFTLLLLFAFSSVAVSQDKPLTQAEFVKLLYELPKNPSKKEALVESIRQRGIAFQLTDGLRSLVKSKSGDPVLTRTLEETARRGGTATVAVLPSEKEAGELLAKTREATLAAIDEMPDFVVKQLVSRSYAHAGTNNFRSSDRLTIAVSYRANGGEEYKILAVNGIPQPEAKEGTSYMQAGGTTSAGEFVTVLASIFKPESRAEFQVVDTDTLRNRSAIVYTYTVKRENSKQSITSIGVIANSTISGYTGKIWVDRENARVLRVEQNATEIPSDFPITAANRVIDYDWVPIGDGKYLLPLYSDVRLTSRENRVAIESRNQIHFRNYQKFGTEIRILEDDEVIEEPQPPQKP